MRSLVDVYTIGDLFACKWICLKNKLTNSVLKFVFKSMEIKSLVDYHQLKAASVKKVFFILSLLFLTYILYRYKQKEFLGLSDPQVQTKESIVEYAKKNGIAGDIFIAKDSISYDTLSKYFDFGYIYIFDNKRRLLDCNIENLGGRCFQDIQEDICNEIEIKKRPNLRLEGHKIWDKLLNNSECITCRFEINNLDLNEFDYIIIYTWVMYSKACINDNSIRFMRCADNSKYNIRIFTVNTDYCAHFGN